MKSDKFCVDPFKCTVSAATIVLCIVLISVMVPLRELLAALVLLVIALLFSPIFVLYGSSLVLDEQGVHRRFCGMETACLSWAQIRETGVVGLKVFNNNDPKKTGTRYIYFSREKLSDQERFAMALKWPPKEKLYLRYTKERLDIVQSYWSNTIETYNAGHAFLKE